jgi:hypothetical protein
MLGSQNTSQNSKNFEEFLAGLRFEQRGKLEALLGTSDHSTIRDQ